jgi:hypothetical protein
LAVNFSSQEQALSWAGKTLKTAEKTFAKGIQQTSLL